MKKYLFFLPLLLLCSTRMYGQSVKFTDLVYYTSLSNEGVYNNLKPGTAFRQDYSENVDGQEMWYFKSIGLKPNSERIITGRYTKLYNGTLLHTLVYTSTEVENILDMISQAKRDGFELVFQAADNAKNIYLLSNSMYVVNIFVARDQTSGTVEIKQKEYLDLE